MRKVTVSRMRERYAQTVLTFRIAYIEFLVNNEWKSFIGSDYDQFDTPTRNVCGASEEILRGRLFLVHDLRAGFPEYETVMLTTRPRCCVVYLTGPTIKL